LAGAKATSKRFEIEGGAVRLGHALLYNDGALQARGDGSIATTYVPRSFHSSSSSRILRTPAVFLGK
jgi:hypothetical protein